MFDCKCGNGQVVWHDANLTQCQPLLADNRKKANPSTAKTPPSPPSATALDGNLSEHELQALAHGFVETMWNAVEADPMERVELIDKVIQTLSISGESSIRSGMEPSSVPMPQFDACLNMFQEHMRVTDGFLDKLKAQHKASGDSRPFEDWLDAE